MASRIEGGYSGKQSQTISALDFSRKSVNNRTKKVEMKIKKKNYFIPFKLYVTLNTRAFDYKTLERG